MNANFPPNNTSGGLNSRSNLVEQVVSSPPGSNFHATLHSIAGNQNNYSSDDSFNVSGSRNTTTIIYDNRATVYVHYHGMDVGGQLNFPNHDASEYTTFNYYSRMFDLERLSSPELAP
ncbi:hypothetical protein AN958_11571 [Leucoagaricus sp. SymC.cos]|nr:hypothetical protein AN958_11571 [Leucoagaricus sp. SymC.cos]